MWRNRLIYLILLAGMTAFFREYRGWISWYGLLVMLALPLLSLVWSLFRAGWIRFRMIPARPRCLPGDVNELSLTLATGQKPPLLCGLTTCVRDEMGDAVYLEKLRFSRRSGEGVILPTEHCGVYTCRARHVWTRDLLGLFCLPVQSPAACTVIVEPKACAPQPTPDLSRFRTMRFRPVPDGGFSEVHEIREYRPGDSLKSVHWKLSAKTGELVVREPQEPIWKSAMLTFALPEARDEADVRLGELLWMSRSLLEAGAGHSVCWHDGTCVRMLPVTCEEELWNAVHLILRCPVGKKIPARSEWERPPADWVYHVGGGGEEVPA